MKKKTNGLLRCFSKYKWLILLSVAIFPFILNSIIAQQIWPYWNVAGDANSWICFWGAYAGAIGTVVMAIIAVEALEVNAEQLEIIKQQNRPYLFCSVNILHQYNPDLKCNQETYILRVENHGIQIAKQVKVKIGILDSWSAYAEGGVGLSFNFSDKGKDSYNDPFGQHHQDATYQDYGYQYRMFQTALNFGLGVMYEITNNFNVFAQITVNNALSNTFNKTMQQQTGSIIRTNFVGLEIGICN